MWLITESYSGGCSWTWVRRSCVERDDVAYPGLLSRKRPVVGYPLFQYGRYLLISSSQPGGQPANLQGIWNRSTNAPWDSKYTININTEMNYWLAEVANLSEMHQPLFSMLEDLSVTGAKRRVNVWLRGLGGSP